MLLPRGFRATTFYQYGAEADDPLTPQDETVPHFYEFLCDTTPDNNCEAGTGAELFDDDGDGSIDRIVLYLVDGGRGDSDRAANGVIADPGAPAVRARGQGNVTARVIRGRLTLRGDTTGNVIHIQPGAAGSVSISGEGTMINGRFDPLEFARVRGISVEAGSGDDQIFVEGAMSDWLLPDTLRVNAGAGNDSVTIERVRIARRSQIDLATGNDSLLIDRVASQRGGRLNVQSSTGQDLVRVIDSILDGGLVADLSRSDDTLELTDSTVRRPARFYASDENKRSAMHQMMDALGAMRLH
jgi:hypothetical protein